MNIARNGTYPFNFASALPDLERQLEVLAAPHQQSGIVGSELQEVFAVDGEEAAGMRRRLIRFTVVRSALLLALRNLVLFVQHAPLEDAAVVMTVGVHRAILEVLVVHAVDDGNRHDGVVAVDRGEERRQPVLVDFAVSV